MINLELTKEGKDILAMVLESYLFRSSYGDCGY